MQGNESTTKSWSSTEVYGLVLICLLLAVGIGYWARGSFQAYAVKSQDTKPVVAHASNVRIQPDQLKQVVDKQIEPLLAQLQKTPEDPSLLAEIGKTYYQTRQFAMAVKYYEDSVRIKPDATVFVKLGGACHFAGDDDKAIGAWNQALRLDPNNPDALFNIGFVMLHAHGDRKAAIAAWQKLLKTNPNHPKRAQVEDLIAKAKQTPKAPMTRNE